MSFNPARSNAIRTALIDTAASQPVRTAIPRRIGAIAVGTLLGSGLTTAAFAATGNFASDPERIVVSVDSDGLAPAPAGVTPGMPIISLLGEPIGVAVTDYVEVPLTDYPEGATHVRVGLTCTSAGTFYWGLEPTKLDDPVGDASLTCDDQDLDRPLAPTAWMDWPIDEGADYTFVNPSAGATATLTVQYSNQVPTRLGINANGETYGASGGPQGEPDLVAVIGTAPNGDSVFGYARSSDVNPPVDNSPEGAALWNQNRSKVPVFEPDGTTQIGTFQLG